MGPDDDQRTRPVPPTGQGRGGASGPTGDGLGGWHLVPEDDDSTQVLPGSLFPEYNVRKPPKARIPGRWRPFLLAGGSVVAIVVVVFGVLFTSAQIAPKSALGSVFGCTTGTPCGVAEAYVGDLTSNNYQAIYGLTSAASRQRFSNPQILSGPGYSYANAHDYIVTRTSSFAQVAQVTHISGSTGDVKQISGTQASVPARIVYSSSVFGDIIENITIPLVSESGQWKVNWSPGLIVPQLDDTNGDPNYTRHIVANITAGKRGTIYDNCASSCVSADVLAQDTTVWQIEVNTAKVQNETALEQALSSALASQGISADQIKTNYEAPWNCGPSGYRLVATLTQQPSAAVNSIAGVTVNQTTGRVYPYGASLTPVTGWIAPITADQLSADTSGYYNQCSLIGDTGVEAWGEQYLRSVEGGTLAIYGRNADGSNQQTPYFTVTATNPANGDDIHTTINLQDQLATVTALGASVQASHVAKGAGSFAMNPTTGAVLEMASTPACDPNAFAQGNVAGQSGCVQENYALQATVPTGSVYKVVTLSAALQNNVITPTQQFPPLTSYLIPGQPTPVPNTQGVCMVPLVAIDALSRSCDLIYYQIGVQLGDKDPTLLPTMGRAYGFGASPNVVGIPSDEQAAGLVPDPTYYQQHNLGGWAPVDSANLAIGQGLFQASPAQVALLSAAIANNGTRMQPQLVSSITNGSTVVQSYMPQQVGTLPISATNLALLQQGMVGVTQDPNGTAYPAFKGFSVIVAGKTGTAESGQPNAHGWFAFYAPAAPSTGQPQQSQVIAGATLVLYAGSGDAGDRYAAPVCRALVAAAFNASSGQGG